MKLFYFLLAIGAIAALVRIVVNVRRIGNQEVEDWDSRLIARLRKQGSDPFQPHELDFFFAMPNEAAARAVAVELEREGCTTDVRETPTLTDHPWSVHARRESRLSVPEMRATTRRYEALATAQGGRYDGWAAAHAERAPDDPDQGRG
jgi:hypothetical protein